MPDISRTKLHEVPEGYNPVTPDMPRKDVIFLDQFGNERRGHIAVASPVHLAKVQVNERGRRFYVVGWREDHSKVK